MEVILIALSLVPFYLVGTFPTGHLLAKRAGIDISKQGSGNVGATNVARVLGKKAGLLTLLIDILKGALPVVIARMINAGEWYTALVAVVVVLGHCISLPPRLKGGKGVATSLGALLVLSPLVALSAVTVFAALFYWKRIVSLSSVSAALSAPLSALLLGAPDEHLYGIIPIALVVVVRHKENLKRLTMGTEPRSTFGASGGAPHTR